jgi:hypothetical protein
MANMTCVGTLAEAVGAAAVDSSNEVFELLTGDAGATLSHAFTAERGSFGLCSFFASLLLHLVDLIDDGGNL